MIKVKEYTEEELSRIISTYTNSLVRLAFTYTKNVPDAEDVVQEVMIRLMTKKPWFENENHEKAWLIRVTINACHDLIRSFFRSKTVSLDAVSEQLSELSIPDRDVLEAVLSLPVQYKDVVYLYYYEGYSAVEIAGILHKKVNTIYTLLSRAKALLKKTLGGNDFE